MILKDVVLQAEWKHAMYGLVNKNTPLRVDKGDWWYWRNTSGSSVSLYSSHPSSTARCLFDHEGDTTLWTTGYKK